MHSVAVIDPSRIGKSSIMRHVTRDHNSGLYKNTCGKEKIVYHEVKHPLMFGYELAMALNIPTSVNGYTWLLENFYPACFYHLELIKLDAIVKEKIQLISRQPVC